MDDVAHHVNLGLVPVNEISVMPDLCCGLDGHRKMLLSTWNVLDYSLCGRKRPGVCSVARGAPASTSQRRSLATVLVLNSRTCGPSCHGLRLRSQVGRTVLDGCDCASLCRSPRFQQPCRLAVLDVGCYYHSSRAAGLRARQPFQGEQSLQGRGGNVSDERYRLIGRLVHC